MDVRYIVVLAANVAHIHFNICVHILGTLHKAKTNPTDDCHIRAAQIANLSVGAHQSGQRPGQKIAVQFAENHRRDIFALTGCVNNDKIQFGVFRCHRIDGGAVFRTNRNDRVVALLCKLVQQGNFILVVPLKIEGFGFSAQFAGCFFQPGIGAVVKRLVAQPAARQQQRHFWLEQPSPARRKCRDHDQHGNTQKKKFFVHG